MSEADVPRARSAREMKFAASLVPCPACGHASPTDFEIHGGADRWTLTAPCPSCGKPRAFSFSTIGHPLDVTPAHRHLGGDLPSQVITPAEFLTELDHLLPELENLDLEHRAPAEWRARAAAKNRASTCVIAGFAHRDRPSRGIMTTRFTSS